MRLPRRGEGWRHYKGTLYEIVGTGFDTETGHAVVTYWRRSDLPQHQRDPELYTRPLNVFLGCTAEDKRRFTFERERD